MKRYLLLFAIAFFCLLANAQDSLTNHLAERIIEHFCRLNDYISFMADKTNDLETRQFYKKQALKLFVGHGYDYEEDGIRKEGARIIISSANKPRTRSLLVRVYFNGLANLSRQKVSLDLPNIEVNGLTKIDSSLYVCICYYKQEYIGYKDGQPIYKDITLKKAKCYIEEHNTEEGNEYTILFGDIYATDKKGLK